MNSTTTLASRFSMALTSFTPWLLAFVLVGCNFQTKLPNLPGLSQEAPKISLEIPRGYAPAKSAAAAEKSWEQVAAGAERMAFHGPALEQPVASPAAAKVAETTTVQSRLLEVLKPGKSHKKLTSRKTSVKKRYASTGKYWKPVKLINKRKKLADNF